MSKPQDQRVRTISGIVSSVLLIAFIGACLTLDAAQGDEPAKVTAKVLSERNGSQGTTLVVVEVHNVGDATAEEIVLRGEIPSGDPVDRTVDFLAPDERDEVTYVLARGEKTTDFAARVLAWTEA